MDKKAKNKFSNLSFAPFDLSDFEKFKSHPLVKSLIPGFDKDSTIAKYSVKQLVQDLEDLNRAYFEKNKRVIFTTIEGRIKSQNSFLRKLYKMCCEKLKSEGITHEILNKNYKKIFDLCGIRYSCPYYDEIEWSINNIIRKELVNRGYAIDLRNNPRFKDKNYLDEGDKFGYRSYHFFVKIPTVVDIFNTRKMCLCEIQARTELQHIWAIKSHDLIYRPEEGWDIKDKDTIEDMRQLSNNLRAADQTLISIRNRIRGQLKK